VAKLSQLVLSNEAIWQRELSRPPVRAPWVILGPYYLLCLLLDGLFSGQPISRFYFLEVVARMPYFSYITMLHTYETLGWWRRSSEVKRVHFAEEMNELNHLLIWESLGGDQDWRVRFLAQHSAIAYYFLLIALWIASPSIAYNFSELM
jgi:ubiquinol oxidase